MPKIPLILLPGIVCDEENWQYQIAHLQDLAECIIPSLSKADTPQAMVDTVLAVAPHQFALAGHSMGGWVAIEVAKRIPDRISKLCLIDTTAEGDTPEKKAARLEMLSRAEQGDIDKIICELLKLFTFNTKTQEQVRRMFARNANAFVHQQKAIIARESSIADLAKITCPTLVINARLDQVYPLEYSERIVAGLPDAKLAVIENSGHMVTIEMPEAVTALMRYWLMYF